MDLVGIMLSAVSQMEKHKYHVISYICEIKRNKQNKQTKPNKDKHIDTENRVVVTRGEGGWGGGQNG